MRQPPTRVWDISFVCRLLNSTLEFEKCVLKRLWHVEIVCPNFVTSTWQWWKASIIIFESKKKSSLSNCMSLNHRKEREGGREGDRYIDRERESVCVCVFVLANVKVPSSLRIYMSIHILFNWSQHEASTLYFRQPRYGRCQVTYVTSRLLGYYYLFTCLNGWNSWFY